MRPCDLSRSVLTGGLAVALLTGCGGAPPPVSAPAVMHRSSSSSGDLLYVADGKRDLRVFSYPEGAFIERITSVPIPVGMCSDSKGNVFVLSTHPYEVLEFAHGATEPSNTFSLRDLAQGCAVDANTNNLAVPQGNSVAIYPNEQGPAQTYSDSDVTIFQMCTYDGHGNLFLSTGPGPPALVEFVGSTFSKVSLSQYIDELHGLQWDGKYLAINDFVGGKGVIYQVQVSGTYGKVVGQTSLDGAIIYGWFSWIQNGTVIVPIGTNYSNIYFWKYPKGGSPTASLKKKDLRKGTPIRGLTVSVAPSAY